MAFRYFPLSLIPHDTSFDFMGKRKWWFTISTSLLVISLLLIAVRGFHFGIDFAGGILIEARFDKPVALGEMREQLSQLDVGDVSLQTLGVPEEIMIRIGQSAERNPTQTVEKIKASLQQSFGTNIEYRKIDVVGPQVGQELVQKGGLALLFSFFAIMVYVWFRFEWQYGVGAIAALLHDAVFTLGFFSLTQLEFNLTSIAALLTIIGYSINDSVVIYDRIRENMRKYKKMSVEELLNASINQTLSRTILTVCTTLVATLALIFFGGEVIRSFSISVFFGILIGTYSSIYISAPILIYLRLRRPS